MCVRCFLPGSNYCRVLVSHRMRCITSSAFLIRISSVFLLLFCFEDAETEKMISRKTGKLSMTPSMSNSFSFFLFFFVGTCFRLAFYYFATSCNRVRRHFIHLLFTHFSRESCHYNGTKSPISLRKSNFLWEFDAVVSALSLLSFHRVHLALPFYLTGRSSSSGSMAFHLVLVHVHIVWTPSPKETVVKRGPW